MFLIERAVRFCKFPAFQEKTAENAKDGGEKDLGAVCGLRPLARTGDRVTVHGMAGDCPVFRPGSLPCENNVDRKHGTVPLARREGDSPIFAAFAFDFRGHVVLAAKIGTVPCERKPVVHATR